MEFSFLPLRQMSSGNLKSSIRLPNHTEMAGDCIRNLNSSGQYSVLSLRPLLESFYSPHRVNSRERPGTSHSNASKELEPSGQ